MPRIPPALPPLVILAALACACGGPNPREARAELLSVDQKFAAEVADKGLSVFEQYYAEDAVEMPTYQPIIEGKTAILDFYRPYSNNPHYKLTWKPSHAEASKGGDFGFTYGQYQATTVDDQGNPVTRTGKYVTVWRRDYDGWKVILDGGSPDQREAPLPAAPQPAPPAPGTRGPLAPPTTQKPH
jgi:ketosteroid isomerase-like protein